MTRKHSAKAALLWASVAVGWLGGCGSSDDDGGAVLAGEDAVQAAAQAAVSLTGAIEALLDDPSAGLTAGHTAGPAAAALASGEAAGLAAVASAGETRRTARAVELACELGGVVDGDCREEGGRTIVTTRSRDCAIFDETLGVSITANGGSNLIFEATGICGRSTIPDDVDSTTELRDYREEWHEGSTLVRVVESSRLDLRTRPDPGGCSINDGEVRADGDLRLEGFDFDWSLRMDDLEFAISSQGNPCDETAFVDGRIDVGDGIRGARFSASLDGLRVDTRRAFDGVLEVAVNGPIDVDCVGPLGLSTRQRIALLGACPVEGELGLDLAGAPPATASFSSAGIALDYDSNGATDFTAAGCGSESLAVCQ